MAVLEKSSLAVALCRQPSVRVRTQCFLLQTACSVLQRWLHIVPLHPPLVGAQSPSFTSRARKNNALQGTHRAASEKKSEFADTMYQNQCCTQSTLCDYSSDGTKWMEAAAVTRLMGAANWAGAKLLFIPLLGLLLFSIRPLCFSHAQGFRFHIARAPDILRWIGLEFFFTLMSAFTCNRSAQTALIGWNASRAGESVMKMSNALPLH